MARPIEATPPIEGDVAEQLAKQLEEPVDLQKMRERAKKARERLREVLDFDDAAKPK